MKLLFTVFGFLSAMTAFANQDSLPSELYAWKNLKVEKEDGIERRSILEGNSSHLDYIEIHTTTVPPGKMPHPPHSHIDTEELIIIKEGILTVTIGDSSKVLGPGSIAVVMPGDHHGFVNTGNIPATYYVIKYRSRAPADSGRAGVAGGSILMRWSDVPFKALPKGGSMQFFERSTGMLKRLEMHVTTLKEGLKSHDPHTHVAEEIILVLSGEVEMMMNSKLYKGNTGDLLFVRSGDLHAPRNAGNGECMYFAIQWH